MAVGGRTSGRRMSRTVVWLVAGGAVLMAGAAGVAWRAQQHEQAGLAFGSTPAAPAGVATNRGTAAEAQPQTTPPTVPVPTFDVARIGPDGRAVIAGRAEPHAKIILLNGGREIAQSRADANGEWVILLQDQPLASGQHELRAVQHVEGRAPATSEQVVVAVVPKPSAAAAGGAAPDQGSLVMIAPPSGPAALVQVPSPAGVPKAGDLVMSTIDYDQNGQVTITGQATAGAPVRVYIDDRMVAEGRAGTDGRWRLSPVGPVDAGKHTLRLDRLAKDGRPVARLEVGFERAAVTGGPPDSRRLIVVQGDNLWNIARSHYGDGIRHTVIFGANKEQIRDPNLIYPGQVFTLPKVN